MAAEAGPKLRPWEIRKLTFSEIALYLDCHGQAPTPPAGGITFGSRQEQLAYYAKRRAMTPMERLEEALANSEFD